jgi:hypothetical protein
MESRSKSVLRIGWLFIAGGLVSVIGGALTMVAFFKQPDAGGDVTAFRIVRGVVLPHIFIFLGLGVLIYGIILISKIMIIAKRKKHLPQ